MADGIDIYTLSDRDGWEAAQADGGLPSQSWAYADALSASGVAPQLAVVRAQHGWMIIPFYEREWGGQVDIATIPGLSGASISPRSASALKLWREYATAQGWVAGYIQLAISARPEGLSSLDEPVTSNEVFLLDLGGDRDVVGSASRTIRRRVKRAEASGAVLVDDRSALSEALVDLYPETMRRVEADPPVRYTPTSLVRWATDPSSVVVGAKVGETIEAVLVVSVAGRLAEGNIIATTDSGRALASWLYAKTIGVLRHRGVETWNFGGGVRPGDDLYRFKTWWHGSVHPLRAIRQIYDTGRYRELCERAGASGGGRWFPAYRTPS